MRVTADTNIYISGLIFDGAPSTFLMHAAEGEFRLSISDAILDEVIGKLRDKFLWSEDQLATARLTIASMTEHVTPKVILEVVKADPDDNAILECAQTAHADYVVSGDRHLLNLRQYDGIPIITVSEFLSQLWNAGTQERA